MINNTEGMAERVRRLEEMVDKLAFAYLDLIEAHASERRTADEMARVAIDWCDRGVIDTRSHLADVLLRYAAARTGAMGDELNELRKVLAKEAK